MIWLTIHLIYQPIILQGNRVFKYYNLGGFGYLFAHGFNTPLLAASWKKETKGGYPVACRGVVYCMAMLKINTYKPIDEVGLKLYTTLK